MFKQIQYFSMHEGQICIFFPGCIAMKRQNIWRHQMAAYYLEWPHCEVYGCVWLELYATVNSQTPFSGLMQRLFPGFMIQMSQQGKAVSRSGRRGLNGNSLKVNNQKCIYVIILSKVQTLLLNHQRIKKISLNFKWLLISTSKLQGQNLWPQTY